MAPGPPPAGSGGAPSILAACTGGDPAFPRKRGRRHGPSRTGALSVCAPPESRRGRPGPARPGPPRPPGRDRCTRSPCRQLWQDKCGVCGRSLNMEDIHAHRQHAFAGRAPDAMGRAPDAAGESADQGTARNPGDQQRYGARARRTRGRYARPRMVGSEDADV